MTNTQDLHKIMELFNFNPDESLNDEFVIHIEEFLRKHLEKPAYIFYPPWSPHYDHPYYPAYYDHLYYPAYSPYKVTCSSSVSNNTSKTEYEVHGYPWSQKIKSD